jgi:hypothetical protein
MMMDILIKREISKLALATRADIGGNDVQLGCEIMTRIAVITHPYGRLVLAQSPGWADPVIMWYQGHLLPFEIIQSLFQEIAQHDIPDDHFIRLHRPEPQPGQVGYL